MRLLVIAGLANSGSYKRETSGLGPASPSPAAAAHGGEIGRCTTELYHTEMMMPAHVNKLMKDIHLSDVALIEIALDAIEEADQA